jgi:hypothetical protein
LADDHCESAAFADLATGEWKDRGITEWAEEWGEISASHAKFAADLKGGIVAYRDGLRRKYERAAHRPWETIPADPPLPPFPPYPEHRPQSGPRSKRPESSRLLDPSPGPESVPIPPSPAGSLFELKPDPAPPPP